MPVKDGGMFCVCDWQQLVVQYTSLCAAAAYDAAINAFPHTV
jgi:hypothetical protein